MDVIEGFGQTGVVSIWAGMDLRIVWEGWRPDVSDSESSRPKCRINSDDGDGSWVWWREELTDTDRSERRSLPCTGAIVGEVTFEAVFGLDGGAGKRGWFLWRGVSLSACIRRAISSILI